MSDANSGDRRRCAAGLSRRIDLLYATNNDMEIGDERTVLQLRLHR